MQKSHKKLIQSAENYLLEHDIPFELPGKIVSETESEAIVNFFRPNANHPDYVIDPPDMNLLVNKDNFDVEYLYIYQRLEK